METDERRTVLWHLDEGKQRDTHRLFEVGSRQDSSSWDGAGSYRKNKAEY